MDNKDNGKKIIKIILIGNAGVGKTSLVNAYDYGKFNENSITTQTSNYIKKTRKIGQFEYEIQIWDTPGQERYRSVTNLFLRNAKICLLVYDITSETSFQSLDYWIDSIKENLGDDPIIAIIGNKADLFENEKIDQKKGEQYAKKQGALFTLTSAKTNIPGFCKFIEELIEKSFDNLDGPKETESIKLKKNSSISKNICQCLIFNDY